MPETAIGRADIRNGRRVHGARGAKFRAAIEDSGFGEAVEIKPRIELAAAADPLCPVGNAVGSSVHGAPAGGEGGFCVIAHVFRGAGADKTQDLVSGEVGIIDHRAAVVADDTPFTGVGGKGAVLQHRYGSACRGFGHGDIVEEDLSFIQQTQDKFPPLRVRAYGAGRREAFVGIGLPAGAAGLIAGGPVFP